MGLQGHVGFMIQKLYLFRDYQGQKQIPGTLHFLYSYLTFFGAEATAFLLMRAESRFVLLHAQPEFRGQTTKTLWLEILGTSHPTKIFPWSGFRGCFGLAALQTIFYSSFLHIPFVYPFEMNHLLYMVLAYPILTAMRRLQCQSNKPGFIPLRYEGVSHAIKLIFNEEGFRGLYRGFLAILAARIAIAAVAGRRLLPKE